MRTIAHISDLHFGREDKTVQEGLLADLARLQPSLVVVSGDLTQRALLRQFMRARKYLDRIPFPLLVVPGNHDIPFFDITRRFLLPLHRYRYYINNDMNPVYADEEIAVLGINTARSLSLANGRISKKQLRLMERFFAQIPQSAARIVVTHHPFLRPTAERKRKTVVGASQALRTMERCGIDLILAGHFHLGFTTDVRTGYPDISRQIVVAQAGTAISKRLQGEPNAYNVIAVHPDRIEVSVRGWEDGGFRMTKEQRFERENTLLWTANNAR